jgi:hypothetical protein
LSKGINAYITPITLSISGSFVNKNRA